MLLPTECIDLPSAWRKRLSGHQPGIQPTCSNTCVVDWTGRREFWLQLVQEFSCASIQVIPVSHQCPVAYNQDAPTAHELFGHPDRRLHPLMSNRWSTNQHVPPDAYSANTVPVQTLNPSLPWALLARSDKYDSALYSVSGPLTSTTGCFCLMLAIAGCNLLCLRSLCCLSAPMLKSLPSYSRVVANLMKFSIHLQD